MHLRRSWMRHAAAIDVASTRDVGELSTDGEPETAARRGIQLVVGLFVALSFVVVQLAYAQNGSAATGDPCLRTGMETTATGKSNYAPGSLVHMSGTGYAADCDVVVKVTRPD